MTIAISEQVPRTTHGFDYTRVKCSVASLSRLSCLSFSPMSWLVYYAFTSPSGGITLSNFTRLFSESTFIDPLITTFVLATSTSVICCIVAALGLAGGAHRHAAAPDHTPDGHGLVCHPAVSRRHRLRTVGGTQQRADQPILPFAHRRARRRASFQYLLVRRAHLRHRLLHISLCLRPGGQCARSHSGRSGRCFLDPRQAAPGHRAARDDTLPCRRCSQARSSLSSRQ